MFNDLYKIDCELMRGDEYTALAARSLEHSVPIETWHMQFAHFGVDRIKALSKGALVDGLNIKHEQQAPGKCEPCILGNQKRWPFDASVEPETEVLGRVMHLGPCTFKVCWWLTVHHDLCQRCILMTFTILSV